MYRGTIRIDANDFAVVRSEVEPGKNPSMWIKKTDIAHRYGKVDNFWPRQAWFSLSVILKGLPP